MSESSLMDRTALWLDAQIAADLARVEVLQMVKLAMMGNEGAAAALVEVTLLLRKVTEVAEAVKPENEHVMPSGGIATHAAAIQDQINNLESHGFLTNSLCVIKGGVIDCERWLYIDGLEEIRLGKREWLVLKHLAIAALGRPGAYLRVSEIVDALQEDRFRIKAGIWDLVLAEDVHKAIGILREEIEKAGGNPRLIESSESYGGGYRISTPYYNIIIEDLDCE